MQSNWVLFTKSHPHSLIAWPMIPKRGYKGYSIQKGTRQRDSPLSMLETPACGILCPAARSAPSGHVPKKTLDHLLSHKQATESFRLSNRHYKTTNNHNNNTNLPDMIITLSSSLFASMRMSFLRDCNMDRESAFLFRGLFSMILLKDEHWCQTCVPEKWHFTTSYNVTAL